MRKSTCVHVSAHNVHKCVGVWVCAWVGGGVNVCVNECKHVKGVKVRERVRERERMYVHVCVHTHTHEHVHMQTKVHAYPVDPFSTSVGRVKQHMLQPQAQLGYNQQDKNLTSCQISFLNSWWRDTEAELKQQGTNWSGMATAAQNRV